MSEQYYILQGHDVVPASLMDWAHWFKSGNRVVAKTTVTPGIEVSTVFLGLNHAFGPNEPMQIFETMVFGGAHGQDLARYATWAEAEAGHLAMVKLVEKEGKSNG